MLNAPNPMPQAVAQRQAQVSGDWFFWIAGVSAVSSILAFSGTGVYSWLGLGATRLIDAGAVAVPKEAALALDLFAAAVYVLFGWFARRGTRWAFVAGAALYALDGILLLSFRDWFSVAFHAYALFRLFQGFQAAQQLHRLRTQAASYGNPGPPPGDVWPPPPSV